jgi:hypothetical protein
MARTRARSRRIREDLRRAGKIGMSEGCGLRRRRGRHCGARMRRSRASRVYSRGTRIYEAARVMDYKFTRVICQIMRQNFVNCVVNAKDA